MRVRLAGHELIILHGCCSACMIIELATDRYDVIVQTTLKTKTDHGLTVSFGP